MSERCCSKLRSNLCPLQQTDFPPLHTKSHLLHLPVNVPHNLKQFGLIKEWSLQLCLQILPRSLCHIFMNPTVTAIRLHPSSIPTLTPMYHSQTLSHSFPIKLPPKHDVCQKLQEDQIAGSTNYSTKDRQWSSASRHVCKPDHSRPLPFLPISEQSLIIQQCDKFTIDVAELGEVARPQEVDVTVLLAAKFTNLPVSFHNSVLAITASRKTR